MQLIMLLARQPIGYADRSKRVGQFHLNYIFLRVGRGVYAAGSVSAQIEATIWIGPQSAWADAR